MKWKFVSLMGGFTPIERGSFNDAFTDMFNYVNEGMKNDNLSLQELETAMWIETPTKGQMPLTFYTARDLACDCGLMKKLINQK